MALPLGAMAALLLVVVYWLPWYMWLPLLVAFIAVRITMSNFYQKLIHERLSLTKEKMRRNPSYSLDGAYPELAQDRREFIVSLDATSLAAAIREREITCRDAMLAYIKQAQEAHRRTNCLTCHRFDAALKEADALDAMLESTGKPIGPLHGVPFSVKDNIDIAGLDSTIGLAKLCNKPAKQDAVVVQVLKRAGGIPFVKTNVHQLMMGYECSNPVHGVTSNPWNPSRVPGGSSGGEAALLAQQGSAFGIGSDIGGSVRIPAHFCGIYALKPTSKQISANGCLSAVPGQEAVAASLGPMCRSARDIDLLMSVIMSAEQRLFDPEVLPTEFKPRSQTLERHTHRKLRIGYYTNDEFFKPNAACSRAVLETVEALRSAGHEIVEFELPRIQDAMDIYFGLMVADGSRTQIDMMHGEVVDHTLKRLFKNRQLPPIVVRAMAFVFKRIFKWDRVAHALLVALPKTVQETWNLQYLRRLYRKALLESFRAQNVECLITPVHVAPAILHGTSQRILALVSYTGLYNLVDFPAGVVPATLVRTEDKTEREGRDMWDQDICKNELNATGLPIGVQVVCPPFEEALCVDVMEAIASAKPFDHTPQPLQPMQ